MGKKQKDDTPNINATANKDIIQRLNFLYQASVYLQSLDVDQDRNVHRSREQAVTNAKAETPSKQNVARTYKGKHRGMRKVTRKRKSDLARDYIQCMRQVAQKTTVKIDPSLKRSLCFSCNSALVPGVSVSVRIKHSAKHISCIQYTCLSCKSTRRLPSITENRVGSVTGQLLPDDAADEAKDRAAGKDWHRQHHAAKSTSHSTPLFARPDAGHAIFRGNDRFSLDEAGCVPFV